MARSGPINASIILKVKFYLNGVLFDPYSVEDVVIYDVPSGHPSSIATLTPQKESTGIYYITFNPEDHLLSTTPVTLYDEWTWVAEESMVSKTQRYTFYLTAAVEEESEPTETTPVSVACRSLPTWTNRIGLLKVDDLGNGSGIFLGWTTARPVTYTNTIRYNIYYSDTRFTALSTPKAITTDENCIIYLDDPGNVYYFAIRAAEFDTNFNTTEMEQIGLGVYKYPDEQELLNDLSVYAGDGYEVDLADVSGFPATGEILIGTEIMIYSSVDYSSNTLTILPANRGAYLTSIDQHLAGAAVTFWKGFEDGNTVVRQGIATWHNQQAQRDAAIGEYNADADGYRAVNEDILTTDLSIADENINFPGYDFCGYHRPSLQDTFSGGCVGSYIGGEFNGLRGLNLNERNLARLDTMLQVTGEPVILLRRKWTGRRCKCFGLRREHQRTRCDKCYSTGFEGGFDRFISPRSISESFVNTEGFIMIRVHPYVNDLKIEAGQGLIQPDELNCWTISTPSLKDRDIIVRFTEDLSSVEFYYEILNVTRNKILLNNIGQQTFIMRKLDKTDVIYTFNPFI